MGDIKVSVIMPVYNAEKFLEKNLIILTKQTLKEIEFICVNDCSKDNSLNILKAFKAVFPDKFVILDSKENRGPGGARNIGISYARGQYIGFVDADDTVHPDMFKDMYEEAVSGDYDIVSCGFYDKAANKPWGTYGFKGKLCGAEKAYLMTVGYIWNKIYKKELLSRMSMLFREKVRYQDTDFTCEAILRAKNASALPKAYYYYNYNDKSITKSSKYSFDREYKACRELFESIDKRCGFLEDGDFAMVFKKLSVRIHLGSILMNLFFKPDFSLKEFERFDEFARQYYPDYYTFKDNETYDFKWLIYNNLAENPKESYQNLIRFKEKIESGELDKEILQRKAVQGTNENN